MKIIEIIIAIWLGGWIISVCAYVGSSLRSARMTGVPWSPRAALVPIPALLLTWLPTLVIYIFARVKASPRRS